MTYILKLILLTLSLTLSNLSIAEATDLDHDQFAEFRASNPEAILLDVRSTEEYASGFIKGAINIPHTELETILATLKKEDKIIMYCRSGRRAGIVAEQLAKEGYSSLYHLDGDIKGWVAAGKPLEKP